MTKKILLVLTTAAQFFNMCNADAFDTVRTVLEENAPTGFFRTFNGQTVRNGDARKVGQSDGKKAQEPISNDVLQAARNWSAPMYRFRPPAKEDFTDEASYQAAQDEFSKQMAEMSKKQEQQRQAKEALVNYIAAFNKAWAKANPGK